METMSCFDSLKLPLSRSMDETRGAVDFFTPSVEFLGKNTSTQEYHGSSSVEQTHVRLHPCKKRRATD